MYIIIHTYILDDLGAAYSQTKTRKKKLDECSQCVQSWERPIPIALKELVAIRLEEFGDCNVSCWYLFSPICPDNKSIQIPMLQGVHQIHFFSNSSQPKTCGFVWKWVTPKSLGPLFPCSKKDGSVKIAISPLMGQIMRLTTVNHQRVGLSGFSRNLPPFQEMTNHDNLGISFPTCWNQASDGGFSKCSHGFLKSSPNYSNLGGFGFPP